jgi:hypothetical protein
MPSKSDNCRDYNVRIRTVRNPERATLLREAKWTSRARGETEAEFWLRAVKRELLRCQEEAVRAPLSERLKAEDFAEKEVLALLTEDEKREYGV